MQFQLLIGLIISFLPVFELRAGLPIVIDYAIKNSLPIIPLFALVIAINISAIFFCFAFLDFIHHRLLRIKSYKKISEKIFIKTKTKSKKIEKRMEKVGYIALMLFVSIPLSCSGAWTGCLVSWLMDLNRKNSIIAISAGVALAGLFILLFSLGLFLR
jgi:uncharacterized membrane protein